MKKEDYKIITICLFAVNFIIGQFIHHSNFYSIVGGLVSVFTYWMLDYYIPELILIFKYYRCRHNVGLGTYWFVNFEYNKMMYKEIEELESAIKLKIAETEFANLYSEFREVVFDIYQQRIYSNGHLLNFVDPKARYSCAERRAVEWLYDYGYRARNIEELVEDLPRLLVYLKNVQNVKVIEDL